MRQYFCFDLIAFYTSNVNVDVKSQCVQCKDTLHATWLGSTSIRELKTSSCSVLAVKRFIHLDNWHLTYASLP